MTKKENREFMKNFFERYYEKCYNKDKILVEGVGIPPEMLEDGADPTKEWNVWKLILSTVTEEDIKQLEKDLNMPLPECVKAFLSVYHHRFETPIGWNDIKYPFYGFKIAYTHQLADNGYLPIAWDGDSIFIRCIDLSNMPNEEKCPVVEIDHELFFDLQYDAESENTLIAKEKLIPLMRTVAVNFYEYLNGIYDDKIN